MRAGSRRHLNTYQEYSYTRALRETEAVPPCGIPSKGIPPQGGTLNATQNELFRWARITHNFTCNTRPDPLDIPVGDGPDKTIPPDCTRNPVSGVGPVHLPRIAGILFRASPPPGSIGPKRGSREGESAYGARACMAYNI